MVSTVVPGSWPRSKHTPGGGNPRLFYKVQGSFPAEMNLKPGRYGGAGVPAGCSLQSYDRQRHADVLSLGLPGAEGQTLRSAGGDVFDQVAHAPRCLVLRGEVVDPDTFDYFRDAMALLLTILDAGGAAVYDPLLQTWWTPEFWRKVALHSDGFLPRSHTALLVSEDDSPDRRWVHTRGMAKFGRPDISVREVDLELLPAVQELCELLIDVLAQGAVLTDGQELRTEALPGGWQCRYSGYANDPEFNNVHFDVTRIG